MSNKVKLTTTMGDIELTLNSDKAPKTVENFLNYVNRGFYDNTIFHRVIENFMVQGGGFDENMSQKDGDDSIENEADNGLANHQYTIAMARTSEPHSASSQFFINSANNNFLNFTDKTPNGWGYCVFGEVSSGQSVIDEMHKVATTQKAGHGDVPVENIVIKKASII